MDDATVAELLVTLDTSMVLENVSVSVLVL